MKNLNFAFIKEIGEDDVLIECDNQEYEIKLTDDIKQPIFDSVEEGNFIVPFDKLNKKILISIDTTSINEIFSEHELDEIKDAEKNLFSDKDRM